MRKHSGILAVLSMALLAHAGAAYGAATEDPPAGSPAGAIYELPLERGRAEAAPKGSGGTTVPGSEADAQETSGAEAEQAEDDSDEASLYRSENNFGSSSQVPGVPPASNGTAATGRGESDAGDGTKSGLSEGREAAQVADSGNTSSAANVALLGAIALIAIGSGILVRGAGRLKTDR